MFSKRSYERGVVIIRCDGEQFVQSLALFLPRFTLCFLSGCRKNHLIADNLGWFQDGGTNIEQIMQEKGLAVTRVIDPMDAGGAENKLMDVPLPHSAEDSVFETLGEPVDKK